MKLAKFIPIIVFLSKSVYSFYQKKRVKASSNKPKTGDFKKTGFKSRYDIIKLYHRKISDAIVVDQGTVHRILEDDLVGSRHQRFIIKITSDISVLIAHNIDMAKRVSVKKGDFVKFKGEYEWDKRGGIIHWTHDDPKGWHEDGWIEVNNVRVS